MSENEKPQFEPARSTLALNSANTSPADPMLADEMRMRRALGLQGDQPRPRLPDRNDPHPHPQQQPQRPMDRFAGPTHHKRRFVNDGEVPVTVVHGLIPSRRDHADGNGSRNGHAQPTNRLEVAEAALAAEIATRERTERALQEALATIHDLQTKLGHADLARQEAVDALQRERTAFSDLHTALHQAEERIVAAEQAQLAAEQALAVLKDRLAAPAAPEAEPEIQRPRRGRKPRVQTAAEPLPADPAPRTAAPADADAAPEAEPARPRRGRKPRARTVASEAPAPKPRKAAAAGRKSAGARDPKPIRWWVAPRGKKKR